jgi:hypothetical protein
MILSYFPGACQGIDGAPSLDVMLLKQLVFAAPGRNQGNDKVFQYAYRRNHTLLQFLPIKLLEWITKNLADELRMRSDSGEDLSSTHLNRILTGCLVSDTFHMVEFESDLY